MAEFCLERWNKISDTHESKWRYVRSWRKELCEQCGEYKRVIVVERTWSRVQRGLADVVINVFRKRNRRD